MTKPLWDGISTQWNWYCEFSERLGGKPRSPTVSEPATEAELDKLREIAGCELPEELEILLSSYSRKVEFFWRVPDDIDIDDDLESFGGGVLWDLAEMPEFCQAMAEHDSSPWLAFVEALRERLPFHRVGNGDVLALCMRGGRKNCPVIYVSHEGENDPDAHNQQIAPNIVDFLVNWSAIGCIDTDLHYLGAFVAENRLSGYGGTASSYREELLSL